jgi:hypothetical protein
MCQLSAKYTRRIVMLIAVARISVNRATSRRTILFSSYNRSRDTDTNAGSSVICSAAVQVIMTSQMSQACYERANISLASECSVETSIFNHEHD